MQFLPALAAFVVSAACLGLLLSPTGRRILLDRPNERSLHATPVPRSGGIAIVAGVAAGAAMAPPVPAAALAALALAGALAALSLADDVRSLPVGMRLAAHLAAAAAFLAFLPGAREPLLWPLFALAIAWYANLYNFMDGSDGLAGGMAVIGFGAYAAGALLAGHPFLPALCAAIAAAALAFLFANLPPARIFMGDAGSVPLGFLAGALGVLGWREGAWPLWFPVLVFAPFVCDATLTLLRRALRRERVWRAHREHYYQRLLQSGFGHRGTMLVEYAAMAGCAGLALLAREQALVGQAAALAAAALALAALANWVDRRWARRAAGAKA